MTRTILVIALFVSVAASACIKSPSEGENSPYEVEPTLGDLNYATIRVFFATDRDRSKSTRASDMFGFDRGPVTYGTCDVSIPRDHRMGVLESPSFLKLEFHGDPEKHVLLLRISIENKQKYFADVAARLRESSTKNAFIFVHGYNVTFEDAARRTGQMAYDLGFDGAPVFYSWPSQGSLHNVHRGRSKQRMDSKQFEAVLG